MKRVLFFILVGLVAATSVRGEREEITKKNWLFSNTSDIELRSFVRTDTATLLYVKVNVVKREWTMCSDLHLLADGKKLAYRGGTFLVKDGERLAEYPLVLDEPNPVVCDTVNGALVYPRDSLLLRFDPMPPGTVAFDFIESADKGKWPWVVLGIKCNGEPYTGLFTRSDTVPFTPVLSAYTPRTAKAVLRGTIHGYRKEMGSFGYFGNDLYSITGKEFPFEIWCDSLGHFSYEAELSYPVCLIPSVLGRQWPVVLLVPGEELVMDVDMIAMKDNGWYTPNLIEQPGQTPAALFSGAYAALNDAIWSEGWNSGFYVMRNPELHISFQQYASQLWEAYQERLQEINVDKRFEGVQKEYLQLLAQKKYIRERIKYQESIEKAFARSENKSDTLTLEKRKAEFTLLDPHAHELDIFGSLKGLFIILNADWIDYMKVNSLTDSPFYKWAADFKHARDWVARINRLQPVTDERVWDSIAPLYVEPLRQLNDTVVHRMNMLAKGSVGRAHEVPDVAPEQLISAIAGQFKGKVVLFDCWATWCGPCLRGIEQMKDMKEELAGRDVVFVYLTNETSEAAAWTKSVQTISGEHYRIPNAIWEKLPGVQAIPQYFVFDRSGKQIFEQTGWNERLLPVFKELLLNALSE